MATSSKFREKLDLLEPDDKDRIVRMAWEDRTTFEDIKQQFGLGPNEVVKFMRTQLSSEAFKRWRRRVTEDGHLKHEARRPDGPKRFKCSRQRLDGSTKGWK
ncbi:MAG: TIGR03643 family protein [Bdellovibrio sp.]|jgi:uncharacterized protein (TIGR03643 family)